MKSEDAELIKNLNHGAEVANKRIAKEWEFKKSQPNSKFLWIDYRDWIISLHHNGHTNKRV